MTVGAVVMLCVCVCVCVRVCVSVCGVVTVGTVVMLCEEPVHCRMCVYVCDY